MGNARTAWLIVGAAMFASVLVRADEDPRVAYGKEYLRQALLRTTGAEREMEVRASLSNGVLGDHPKAEGFTIRIDPAKIEIGGDDPAGVMYGCLEAARQITLGVDLRSGRTISSAPRLPVRAVGVLLMKQGHYNLEVTPQEFPFFYDRARWNQWLDFMATHRFNALAFWNGHPFAYFVKFDRFQEAQTNFDAAAIERNHAMLRWLIDEAGRRNIQVLFEFYNIHFPIQFQRAHGLPPELHEPTPLVSDYTEYALERFAREFPELGYYITPGEALARQHTENWLNHVVIPSLKRGGARGPIWLRAWGRGIDLPIAQSIATAHPDVSMERKFNVEMLAAPQEDPDNRAWAALTGKHVVNIHEIANLAPFRWWSPSFIRKSVESAIETGANGVHVYARRAWRWPDGAEPDQPFPQWQRDRYWYEAWGRYAWDPTPENNLDRENWLRQLSLDLGNERAASDFFAAQEAGADVLPGLQRLFWLGRSNHTVLSAGIRLAQFGQETPGIPFLPLPEVSQRVPEFLAALRAGEPTPGPTPLEFVNQLVQSAERAASLARTAADESTKGRAEAEAWASDAEAIRLVARFYQEKLHAAELRARAASPGSKTAPDSFLAPLEQSLETFRQLTKLTSRYDSINDVNAENPVRIANVPYHWRDLLPVFEAELAIYQRQFGHPMNTPSAADFAPGLVGVFYSDAELRHPRSIHRLPQLNFNWQEGELDLPGVWSAEWRGSFVVNNGNLPPITVRSSHPFEMKFNDVVVASAAKAGVQPVSFTARAGTVIRVSCIVRHAGNSDPVDFTLQGVGEGSSSRFPEIRHSAQDEDWAAREVLREPPKPKPARPNE